MSNYLTEQEVREYVHDRNAADNDGLDLSYSSADIISAMRRASREFNSITPIHIQTTASQMSGNTNMFLDATVEQLYITELSRLTRNDIDYTAGGVQTPIERRRIDSLPGLIKLHGERFREAAKAYKITKNVNSAFRHF